MKTVDNSHLNAVCSAFPGKGGTLDKKPSINEVWLLKSGRYGLIVNNFGEAGSVLRADSAPGKLGILWYDSVDDDWNVAAIENYLQQRTDISPVQFFAKINHTRESLRAGVLPLNPAPEHEYGDFGSLGHAYTENDAGESK